MALNKGSNVHYLLVKQLERHGLKLTDITPIYLAPGVVNNYQYYLGEQTFLNKNPKVIAALFDDSVAQGAWLKKNLRQAAELIAPLQGLPVDVVELALQRYEFNVKPITAAVAADQQKIADTFFDLKLIPKAIKISEAVVVSQP